MGRKIGIFGVAASPMEREQAAAHFPPALEIWAVNEAHRHMPEGLKVARMFQLHVRDWRESERRFRYSNGVELPPDLDPNCFGRDNAHVEYLRTCGVPVYGQIQWDDIPTSVRYPFEAVTEAVGIPLPPNGTKRLWATSSFGYMAALLLTEHGAPVPGMGHRFRAEDTVEAVYLSAIELPLGTNRERLWEWPNFAYYLGLMQGLGIEVVLPPEGTSLLSAPHYALDGHPYPQEADHWWDPGRAGMVVDGDDGTYRLGTWSPAEYAPTLEQLRASAAVIHERIAKLEAECL